MHTVARDRITGPTRDQREEARAVGEGGIPEVSDDRPHTSVTFR